MRPWADRNGRFSPLRASVFFLLFLPAAWLVLRAGLGSLGPRPLTEVIHQTGLWTIRLLFLSLAVTPVRQALRYPQLILVRRMIGVAAFCYAVIHLSFYAADQAFDLGHVASEIVHRIYLTIGFAAWCGLAALAATSTDAAVRRLGGRRWQRLHRIIYGIALLATIHFFMQSKLDVTEATWMAGLYLWLMLYRVWKTRLGSRALAVWQLGVLALGAGAATFVGEACYFWIKSGVDPLRVLGADFSLMLGLRPGWIAFIAAALIAAAAAARRDTRAVAPKAVPRRAATRA